MKTVFSRLTTIILIVLAILNVQSVLAEQSIPSPAKQELQDIMDQMWEWRLKSSPEFATRVGRAEYNDRWTDLSIEAIQRRAQRLDQFGRLLDAIDVNGLDDAGRLNLEVIRRDIDSQMQVYHFKGFLQAVSQLSGIQQMMPQVLIQMPRSTVKDYDNILARLKGIPVLVDQNIDLLTRGIKAGITQPRIVLRDVPQQVANIIVDDVPNSPLYKSFEDIPENIAEAERKRLRAQAVKLIRDEVNPVLRGYQQFLKDTYIPAAREDIAWSSLPNGKQWYAFSVKDHTTTNMTARQIHELGLSEVKRIREQMDQVMAQVKFEGDFDAFVQFLRTDPQFFYDEPEQLLAGYRDIAKRADAELIQLFGLLPRLPYGIKRIPAYAEKSQTTAYYQPGSMASGRPGIFFANTYKLNTRPKWEMEALTLHEAVPGHHLQLALAEEMTGVHDLLKHIHYTAYIEGWGLYAESLGEEMGFYRDPYAKFGQLSYEMWRAVRLVVDTGMHALGWSREQAIDYFLSNAPKTKHDIIVEIDRYIVWPGQALAYKVGQIKIKQLRERAQQTLGSAFDIRDFHDHLLAAGSLPLDLLEQRMSSWITSVGS